MPLHIIGIPEDLPALCEVPPPCVLRDLAPGQNLLGGIWILLRSKNQVLFGDDRREVSFNVLQQTEPLRIPRYLSRMQSANRSFHRP